MMNGPEKSDPAIVAMKPTNKAGQPAAERSAAEPNAAEPVERRAGTKGKRVTGAGTHTQSGNGKEEGEVHHALPPHRHRSLGGGVLRTCAERSPRRGSDDVEGLRGRHRAQSRGFARPGPTRSVSGTAEPAGLHSQAGWTAAPARGRSP